MRRFLRDHPKFVWSIGAAVVMLVVVALLIIWESGYECVRWSTRINMDTHGGVYHERNRPAHRKKFPQNYSIDSLHYSVYR